MPEPQRPWWKRKRWRWPLAALLACHLYALSSGPAFYASGRGWLSRGIWFFYMPIIIPVTLTPLEKPALRYLDWCFKTGERHAASN